MDRVFKCPADKSLSKMADGRLYPRLRSYSMNRFLANLDVAPDVYYLCMTRADINSGPRREVFVFLDVHEDYVDTSTFPLSIDINVGSWEALPAALHGGKAVLSYA